MENSADRLPLPDLSKYCEADSKTDSGFATGSFTSSCDQDVNKEFSSHGTTEQELEHSIHKLSINEPATRNAVCKTENANQQEMEKCEYIKRAFTPDEDNDTYLNLFLAQQKFQQAEQLIQICPEPTSLDIQNNRGQAAIHVAAYLDCYHIIHLLIMHGADISLVDDSGRNIFHLVAERGHKDTLMAIIHAVEQRKQIELMKDLLNQRDFSGLSPFYVAVFHKRMEICKVFAHPELQVDVDLNDVKTGNSPLHEAMMEVNGADSVFIRFLLHDCKVNVNSQNYSGVTALHITAARGDKAACSVLLMLNADVNIKDISDNVPAVYATNTEIVKHLQG